MKALLLSAIGELRVVDAPPPDIEGPDDVLLRVRSVGVCGSDLHGYLGHSGRRQPPLIMGHEAAGEVVEVGSEVSDLSPGDRVAVQPVSFCGRCAQCLAGNRSLCEQRLIMGMNAPGAYAEYVTWPATNLVPLPPQLTHEGGALAEPLSIAVHAVGLAHIRPGDSAFVVGAGPIGLLTVAVLKQSSADRIIVSDLSDARLEEARTLGADVTINPRTEDLEEAVADLTGGSGVDVAVEAVGLSATAQQTLEVVRNKGTVVWIGNNQRMIEVDMQAIVTRELTVLGAYGMSSLEFERSLQMLADGLIPYEQIISRRATLEEGPHLFDELLETPEVIKCLFNFD